jgi:hypothetical protein
MTTMNAKAECVPGIWRKWWNALVNCFKREAVRTCSAERQPTPKVEDANAQGRKAGDMKAASEPGDRVLEFPRARFGEATRGEDFLGGTWTGSTESRPAAEPRGEAASPGSKVPFAGWSGWVGRGIPELASPLAD